MSSIGLGSSSIQTLQASNHLLVDENKLINHEELNSSNAETSAQTSKNSLLSRIASSAFDGLKACLMTSGAFFMAADQRMFSLYQHDALTASCLVGAGVAAKTFYSLSRENKAAISPNDEIQPSPDVSFPQTNTRIAKLDKLAESLKLGWKGYASSFLTSIIGLEVLFKNPNLYMGEMIAGSALIGSGLAIGNYLIKPPENQETVNTSKLRVLARSVFQGLFTGAATLGSLLSFQLVIDRMPYHNSSSELALFLVPGIERALYSFTRRSAEESTQHPEITQQNRSRLKNLSIRVAKSLGDGLVVSTATAQLYILFDIYKNNSALFILPTLAATIGTGVHTYFSQTSTFYKDRSKKVIDALHVGIKSYLASSTVSTGVAMLLRDVLSHNLPRAIYYKVPELILGGSVVFGTYHAITSLINPEASMMERTTIPIKGIIGKAKSGLSTVKNTWKEASKLKKATTILLSLVALSTLGVLYVGPETAKNETLKLSSEIYQTIAYSEKNETSTIKLSDLKASYNDFDEMNRLANFINNPDRPVDDISCAEILNTCHLDETNRSEHKKIYLGKLKKFHPDKNPNNKELASLATQALSIASKYLRSGTCPGQDDGGCLMNDNELEITKILRRPKWLFANILEGSCTFVINEVPNKVTMDYCKDI